MTLFYDLYKEFLLDIIQRAVSIFPELTTAFLQGIASGVLLKVLQGFVWESSRSYFGKFSGSSFWKSSKTLFLWILNYYFFLKISPGFKIPFFLSLESCKCCFWVIIIIQEYILKVLLGSLMEFLLVFVVFHDFFLRILWNFSLKILQKFCFWNSTEVPFGNLSEVPCGNPLRVRFENHSGAFMRIFK